MSVENKMTVVSENSLAERCFRDAMFDANPYISVIFNADMNAVDCNPAAIAYFGYDTRADFLKGIYPRLQDSIPEFQPDGSPSVPLSKRFDYAFEHGFIEFESEVLLDKKRIPLRFTLKKVYCGDTVAIAAYMLDMQVLKEARNELLRQDMLMRQVNRAATRLMSADPDNFRKTISRVLKGLAQSVNANRMYIWENYEAKGQLWSKPSYHWDVDGEAQQELILDYTQFENFYKLLSAKQSMNFRLTDISEDKRAFLNVKKARIALLVPIFVQDKFWGFVGLDKNVDNELFTATEEKVIRSAGMIAVSGIVNNNINKSLIEAREDALASDKAKSEFLSRMSHEIRTPINAIIGMTTIARKSQEMESVQFSLEKIERASAQLLQIINDILDMSKIESGKFEIASEPFDFIKLMTSIFDMMEVRFAEKNQHFVRRFEKSFDRIMVSDELRISQVVINLLTNASKFSPENGEVSFTADYRKKEEECYTLHVEIQDNGIGISDDQQKKLFKSFEQADGSITRRFGGTGLGLAICKNITGLMGGDIWVRSIEGKGSVFIFEVDFNWGDPLAGDEDQTPRTKDSYDWHDKEVLVVEDIAINREIIYSLLTETGVNLTSAENGQIAVDIFERDPEKYDLILMDLQMPQLDGLGATKRIRGMDVSTAETIPILAMTANVFAEDVKKCLEAGMNGHVAKPIDVENLLEKMSSYLDK